MVNPFEIIIQQNAEIIQHLQELKSLGIILPERKNEATEQDQKFDYDGIANYLNKDKSTIHRYKKNGSLPYHQVGRTVYFLKSQVDAAMSSMSNKKRR
jgi:excisionase family DNA binding protein